MLFAVIVIAVIVGIILIYKGDTEFGWKEYLFVPGVSLFIIGFIGLMLSIFFLGIEYIGCDGYVAEKQVEYETIMYQLDSDIYTLDIGVRDLMEDVQEWNTWLARCQSLQNDFWVGIYYADIYDQFEFIELGG